MDQAAKASLFSSLHVKADPIVLYNIWDAGGAKTLADAGVKAVATGSWSVAAAHGYADGEQMPLDFSLRIVEQIAKSVEVPLTVDFEGGYAVDPEPLAANITRLIAAGAIGLNFEDRVVGGRGLHAIETQVARIRAIRAVADDAGVPLFINARTDTFLQAKPDTHASLIDDALERASAYAEAGASGFFVPGLTDLEAIKRVTDQAELPVNGRAGWDYVLIGRAGVTATRDFAVLQQDLQDALARIHTPRSTS